MAADETPPGGHKCSAEDGCFERGSGEPTITQESALGVIASELRMLRKLAHTALYDPKSETSVGYIFSVVAELEALNANMEHLITHVASIDGFEHDDGADAGKPDETPKEN